MAEVIHLTYDNSASGDLSDIADAPALSIDVEATGSNLGKDTPIGMSMAYRDTDGFYLAPENIRLMKDVLEDESIIKVGSFISYDIGMLEKLGIDASRGGVIDIAIAAHLAMYPALNLQFLARSIVDMHVQKYEDLKHPLHELPFETQGEYSIPHSIAPIRMWPILEEKLRLNDELGCFWDIEMPLVPVIAAMQRVGARIDVEEIKRLGEYYGSRAEIYSDVLDHYAGRTGINHNSPDQVAKLLFEELGLPGGKKTKGGKRYSVQQKTIKDLRNVHPYVKVYELFKQVHTLKSMYVDGLLSRVVGDRLHTSFNQTGTRTGRLSSSDPNLQNIPQRLEIGRRIRRAFVASEGRVLITPDYEQLELRKIADMSNDPVMCEVFNEGDDIHMYTAMEMFNDPSKRQQGKTCNFAAVYGGGEATIAESADIPRHEARKWRKRYFDLYHVLADWMEVQKQNFREAECARTEGGRVRDLRMEARSEGYMFEHGYKEYLSTRVQGSSAELVKKGMVRLYDALAGYETNVLLQVHDELVLDVPFHEVPDVIDMCHEYLPGTGVHVHEFPVEVKIGPNWADVQKVKDLVK